MKKILFAMMCLMAACFTAGAQQDAKYEAELDKAVALSCDKTVLLEILQPNLNNIVAQGLLTQDQCNAMAEEIADLMYPELMNMTKEVWRQEFSYDDLKKIQAWLESPTGHKLLMLGGRTAEMSQQIMQNPAITQKFFEIVGKYTKK